MKVGLGGRPDNDKPRAKIHTEEREEKEKEELSGSEAVKGYNRIR